MQWAWKGCANGHHPVHPIVISRAGSMCEPARAGQASVPGLPTTHMWCLSAPAEQAIAAVQDHSDMDVALVKYRVAAVQTPNSPQLWNNVGERGGWHPTLPPLPGWQLPLKHTGQLTSP